jgi:tRNA dimethylallyltransferase
MTPESNAAPPIVVLIGPTAIGKTALSLELAETFNGEIVSVDSMQVYRYMDIGTAKASVAERARIRHHLIDVVDPDEQYDAARFALDAKAAIAAIHSRRKLPIVTGGTGLYLRAFLEGIFECLPADHGIRQLLHNRLSEEGAASLHAELAACDPISASRVHLNDHQRIVRALEIYHTTGRPWSYHLDKQRKNRHPDQRDAILQIGLSCERQILYQRINQRCLKMIEDGLEGEVTDLLARGYRRDLPSMRAIGYRHMVQYLEQTWSLGEMIEKLSRDTRRYAKRQYTWFNTNPSIEWYSQTEYSEIVEKVSNWLKQHNSA